MAIDVYAFRNNCNPSPRIEVDELVKLTIEVTDAHLQVGIVSNCEYCPIALAIRPYVAFSYTISVGTQAIGITPVTKEFDAFRYVSVLPEKVTALIGSYDMGKPTEPFSFEISVPSKCVNQGKK
jgi:hypothetical protein